MCLSVFLQIWHYEHQHKFIQDILVFPHNFSIKVLGEDLSLEATRELRLGLG